MKLKKYMALTIVGMMALTGCASKSASTTEEQVETGASKTVTTEEKEAASEVQKQPDEQTKELRIVSGTVAATQVLDYLEADLVGVPTTSTTLPERYQGLDEVGMSMNPDLEKVVSLSPDVFIVDKNFKESIEQNADALGLNVFYFDTTTYENFVVSIEELGKAIYKEDKASELVAELKGAEQAVIDKAVGKESPKVAVLFGASENFMLATDSSYVGSLVEIVGGENITNQLGADVSSGYIQFSLEQIVEQNPDYILRFAHGNIEETKKSFDDFFAKNPAWSTLDAVKEGRVIDLDSSLFNVSANIRVKEAITTLGEIFYSN